MSINIKKIFFVFTLALCVVGVDSNLFSMRANHLGSPQRIEDKDLQAISESVWSTLSREIKTRGDRGLCNYIFKGARAKTHQARLRRCLKTFFTHFFTSALQTDDQFFYHLNQKNMRDRLTSALAGDCRVELLDDQSIRLRSFLEDHGEDIVSAFEKNIADQLESLACRGLWDKTKMGFNLIKAIAWRIPEFFMFMGAKNLLWDYDPAGGSVIVLGASAFVIKHFAYNVYKKVIGKPKVTKVRIVE